MNVYYQWKMILVQVSDYTCLFYSFLVSKIKYHFVCTCFLKKKKKRKETLSSMQRYIFSWYKFVLQPLTAV